MDKGVEDMIENSESSSGQNTEVISEIMDFATTSVPADDCEVIDLEAREEMNETLDQLTEVDSNVKHLSAIDGIRTEGIIKKDLETTPVTSTKDVTKIMNQAPEGFSVSENLETTGIFAERVGETPIPEESTTNIVSDKGISKMENETEISEIMDLETTSVPVDDCEVIDLEATEEMNGILDQLTEVDSNVKHLSAITEIRTEGIIKMDSETTPVTSTKDVTKIMNEAPEGFSVSENLETTAIFAERVGETPIPNESTTNIVSDKAISKMENETEASDSGNEKMKIKPPNAEIDKLKVTSGSKRKGRKRKVPPVSDMVIDSIKSLKMSNGASFEDIKKRMEENYSINVKALLKYNVINFLQKSVHNGMLEKTGGDNARFKIKEKSSQQRK